MRKLILFLLLSSCLMAVKAQPVDSSTQVGGASAATPERERDRIAGERARLETAYAAEIAQCYRRFMVNNCLDEVKVRRREAMADLRRQEISLNEQDRRAKAAEQLQKTGEKVSPARQQAEADRRAAAVRDFESKLDREKQAKLDRQDKQSGEKAKSDASTRRITDAQNKAATRAGKQAAAAEEARKFNARQVKAKERQDRNAREMLGRSTPSASALSVPP